MGGFRFCAMGLWHDVMNCVFVLVALVWCARVVLCYCVPTDGTLEMPLNLRFTEVHPGPKVVVDRRHSVIFHVNVLELLLRSGCVSVPEVLAENALPVLGVFETDQEHSVSTCLHKKGPPRHTEFLRMCQHVDANNWLEGSLEPCMSDNS